MISSILIQFFSEGLLRYIFVLLKWYFTMPLPKRGIEPVHVTRGTLPEDFPLPSELEAVTNGTLANTVRQLSSLSKHAEDLFGELARDAQQLYDRSNSLQARIDRLAIKVTQLDSNVEEVSLQDIHMRKAFKSAVVFDQQVGLQLCLFALDGFNRSTKFCMIFQSVSRIHFLSLFLYFIVLVFIRLKLILLLETENNFNFQNF